MTLRHFITTQDWTRAELQGVLDEAGQLKQHRIQPLLRDKAIALLFFNPSLRTRSSFELGIRQLGGMALVLEPGKGAWPIEFEDGVVMDGEAEEHIAEVAKVLSRYCDLIAVRAFPKFKDWAVDREDRVIKQVAKYATVPVINLETITHPCQELAHMLALQEKLGDVRGKKYLLTWTWHPKGLNTAVANSALQIATKFGMDVTLLCPEPAYLLDERYLEYARQNVAENGGSFRVTHDIEDGYRGADVVYCKSWGALPFFGRWEEERPMREKYRHFMVDEAKMALTGEGSRRGLWSHCLPVRRNVKVSDGVIDAPYSIAIDEAENRLHVQKALMHQLLDRYNA
ncbi:MAG: N-acetylornithine carbamoyltransferase [Myxococcota bacterium]